MTAPRPRKARPREKPELIADELRTLILTGEIADGDLLGHEPDLVERFGVSRPSLREALRILETEGLITVVRGVRGGVVVRHPNEALTARTASMLLRSRNVPLADVHRATQMIEPIAAKEVARSARRRTAAKELRSLVDRQDETIDDPEPFAAANAAFHERLVALSGNQTLTLVTEMLNELISRAVADASRTPGPDSTRTRRRGIRSQHRLVDLIEAGDGDTAEEHWRSHLAVVGKVLLGDQATSIIEPLDRD